MTRPFNFGAGPAMLPLEVLSQAKASLLEWESTGVSILELGHRTDEFLQLLEMAEAELRLLLDIPNDYRVLFLGTPARMHFGMIPLNFLNSNQEAAYFVTGLWSSLAFEEANRVGKATLVAPFHSTHFTEVPDITSWQFKKPPAYLYYTPNETVNGLRCNIKKRPDSSFLVADMTSALLTEPLHIRDYDFIFAGAQKNIANAGLTIVIVRDAFLATINQKNLPTFFDYRTHVRHRSLYATPPTFNCYLALLMFRWIQKQGGIMPLYEKNLLNAKRLYDYLDTSSFYSPTIQTKANRSFTNVCFKINDQALETSFLTYAKARGLFYLRGHKTVGGLRASLYNAMPEAGVLALIACMDDFAKSKGVKF